MSLEQAKVSLAALQKEFDAICAARTAKKTEFDEAALLVAFLAYGIRPGVEVVSKGKAYKVTHVSLFGSCGKPWAKGVALKVNGDWSAREVHLFSDWQVIGREAA